MFTTTPIDSDALFVDDGYILTSAGVTVGIDSIIRRARPPP